MNINFTTEKDEILQLRFLGDYLLYDLEKSPECVAFWYYDDENPVSIALYGLNNGIAKLIYMATIPVYQVRGLQTKLQKYAEKTLAKIGITKIEACIFSDEDIISDAFNYEGKKELLEYYKYEPTGATGGFIIKFKNVKDKLLGNMSPKEFAQKMNKTYEILTKEELLNNENLKKKLLSHKENIKDEESGLFAVKDNEIKCGVIYEESDAFDLIIKRIVKIKDAKFLLGPVFANLIVNHENNNDDELKIFTEDESVITLISNIAGKPVEISNSCSFEKIISIEDFKDDPDDKDNYYSIFDKWNMDDEYPENSMSTFELTDCPCATCKYSVPGNYDSCKNYDEIPLEILVADSPCEKYAK